MVVEAAITGRAGKIDARLVLDTGAAATTLEPEIVDRIGYSWRDGSKISKVHTAIGEEIGYWLDVAEFSVLGVSMPSFALTVFPLGHDGVDGLVGMNFLRYFNLEIDMFEQRIVVERNKRPIDPGS